MEQVDSTGLNLEESRPSAPVCCPKCNRLNFGRTHCRDCDSDLTLPAPPNIQSDDDSDDREIKSNVTLTKPVACSKCNRINFTGPNCKHCSEPLIILDIEEKKPKEDEQKLKDQFNEEVANRLANTVAPTITESPETFSSAVELKEKIPKKQFDDNKKQILRKNLQAKLKDSRMTRNRLTKETEVLGKNGKRISGARKVPVTQMLPVNAGADKPWKPMM